MGRLLAFRPPIMPLGRGMRAQAGAIGVCDHRKSRDHLLSFAFCLPMQERGAERFQLELDDTSWCAPTYPPPRRRRRPAAYVWCPCVVSGLGLAGLSCSGVSTLGWCCVVVVVVLVVLVVLVLVLLLLMVVVVVVVVSVVVVTYYTHQGFRVWWS